MHATFGLEITVSVFAAHQQRDRFDPDFFAGLNIDNLRFKSAALDPALIHAQEHVGPIARFGAAGAGMNGEKGVIAIALAGKKLAQLEFLELVQETIVLGGDFALGLRAVSVVFFLSRELMKRIEIFDLALEFPERIDQRSQTRDFIDIGLRALAIVPKIWRRHPRFERGQFFLQFGQVKETSAARARAISNLRRQRWKFRLA